jgi:hypothetical protein
MRREDYKKALSNEQIESLIQKLDHFTGIIRDIAAVAELYSAMGKDTIRSRRALKHCDTPLDFGEFLQKVQEISPEAADYLKRADVLRFEVGRIHLRFQTEEEKASFGWHRHTIETLSAKLYGVQCKLLVRQSVVPY